MKQIPRYSTVVEIINGQEVLCIRDTSDSYTAAISVTNAAEQVLAETKKELGRLPDIIIYRDTRLIWTRMVQSADGNVTFVPIVAGQVGNYDDKEAAALAAGGKV